MTRALLLLLAALPLGAIMLLGPAMADTPAPRTTIVKAARVFDGTSDRLRTGIAVLIVDDRIRALGPVATLTAQAPGATVIDLGDATLMPGLIDAHTHILMSGEGGAHAYDEQLLKHSIAARAIGATARAREVLHAGWTTIRDVESEGSMYADVDLRDAIDRGVAPGPRMQVATRGLAPTGGYLPFGFAWDAEIPTGAQVVDGVEPIRQAVREQVARGADWIKVYADFGTYLTTTPARPLRSRPNFTDAELFAVVAEAHRLGKKVAAHATGWDAIDQALRAGVDSIEHGIGLTDDLAARMVKQRVTLVPTLGVFRHALASDPDPSPKLRQLIVLHQAGFKRAVTKGVAIASGSDAGSYPWKQGLAGELQWMVAYGMTPAQALRAATSVAGVLLEPRCPPDAKVCPRGQLGVLAPAAFADLIAVDGDPLKDVKVLATVRFVMKAGAVVKGP